MLNISRGRAQHLPKHWIGVRKGWNGNRRLLHEALVSLSTNELRKHLYAIGATGSGKSTFLESVIARDIIEGHSFIILDARGNLPNSALELLAGRTDAERVKVFDLRDRQNPLGFNPLAGQGEAYFRALGVLSVIEQVSESWGVQLAETLRNALWLLACSEAPITEIENVFHNQALRNALLERCTSDTVRGFWERYDTLRPDRQASLIQPVTNKVSALLGPDSIRKSLGHPKPLDLKSHLDTPGSATLVSLAIDETHGAGLMYGNMLLNSLVREVFSRVNVPEKERVPVRLIVDEFENFSSHAFASILAEGRKFGIHLVLAHQVLAQLDTKTRSLILNNCANKIVFQTGHEDAKLLNKALSGDPSAFDLANLPVGEAILWRRAAEPVHLTCNKPLISHPGTLSRDGHEFLRQIRSLVPSYGETAVLRTDKLPEELPATNNAQLEDWL